MAVWAYSCKKLTRICFYSILHKDQRPFVHSCVSYISCYIVEIVKIEYGSENLSLKYIYIPPDHLIHP